MNHRRNISKNKVEVEGEVTHRSAANTITDLFAEMQANTDKLKIGYAALGMQMMNEKFKKAIDILLKQNRVTKANLNELKRLIEAYDADINRQIKEMTEGEND